MWTFHASRYQCESNAQWGKHAEVTPGDLADYPVTSTQDSYMLGQTIVFLIITHIYKFSNWGRLNPVGILNTDNLLLLSEERDILNLL